jgi:pimeloyl-ACP methyl ester carboxylesterase
MACYLTALEVDEPITLIGHCVGGAVALQLAGTHPERVRAVLVCNPVVPKSWRRRRRSQAMRVGSDTALVGDVHNLVQRGVPVHVVWSERDRVTRFESFVRLCRAAGVAGEVVPGGHRWLVTDPDRFAVVAQAAMVRAGVVDGTAHSVATDCRCTACVVA